MNADMRICRLVGSAVRRVGEAISGRLSAAYPGAERRICSPPRSRACALLCGRAVRHAHVLPLPAVRVSGRFRASGRIGYPKAIRQRVGADRLSEVCFGWVRSWLRGGLVGRGCVRAVCVAGWLVGWLVCAGVRLRVCLRVCVRVFVSWFVRACVLSWVEIL